MGNDTDITQRVLLRFQYFFCRCYGNEQNLLFGFQFSEKILKKNTKHNKIKINK